MHSQKLICNNGARVHRSYVDQGQYVYVEKLIVCTFNSTTSLLLVSPCSSFLYRKGDYNAILPDADVQN